MIENIELNEAIEEVNQEISDNRNKLKLIKQFNSKLEKLKTGKGNITEEEYHNLCETPLRHTDILGESLTYVIPGLEYKKSYANSFSYTLDGHDVSIPSYCCLGIDLYLDKFDKIIEPYIEYIKKRHEYTLNSYNKNIRFKEDFLNSKGLISKSMIYVKEQPIFIRPIIYIITDLFYRVKNKHSVEDEIKTQLNETREMKEKFLKSVKHKYMVYHEEQVRLHDYLDKYLPILFEWTDTVRVHICESVIITYKKLKTI